jgi:hypothetical protein
MPSSGRSQAAPLSDPVGLTSGTVVGAGASPVETSERGHTGSAGARGREPSRDKLPATAPSTVGWWMTDGSLSSGMSHAAPLSDPTRLTTGAPTPKYRSPIPSPLEAGSVEVARKAPVAPTATRPSDELLGTALAATATAGSVTLALHVSTPDTLCPLWSTCTYDGVSGSDAVLQLASSRSATVHEPVPLTGASWSGKVQDPPPLDGLPCPEGAALAPSSSAPCASVGAETIVVGVVS